MRAFVIGGSGLVGRAVCRRFLRDGWEVDVLARDAARLPADLTAAGIRFFAADRSDRAQLAAAYGDGADLLVDCACFTGRQAADLVPLARSATSTVMISSKAVYVDAAGRHSNSPEPPRFEGPVAEPQPTLEPGEMDYRSREGYGRNKAAAERVLLESGLPVTILRPSKIHGEGARPAREWVFVKRVLDGRRAVLLAHGGRGTDHPTAAANVAELVALAAAKPGARILNAADPDSPSGLEIARAVASHFGHEWREVLLDDDVQPPLGWHPWDKPFPFVLDMTAVRALGYEPAGDYATTVATELDWLASIAVRSPDAAGAAGAGAQLPPEYDADLFRFAFDYAAEDAYLERLGEP